MSSRVKRGKPCLRARAGIEIEPACNLLITSEKEVKLIRVVSQGSGSQIAIKCAPGKMDGQVHVQARFIFQIHFEQEHTLLTEVLHFNLATSAKRNNMTFFWVPFDRSCLQLTELIIQVIPPTILLWNSPWGWIKYLSFYSPNMLQWKPLSERYLVLFNIHALSFKMSASSVGFS